MRKLSGLLTAAAVAVTTLASVSTYAQATIYSTSFESSGDPSGVNFTANQTLNGQGEWTVEGTATVLSTGGAQGTNFVQQASGSQISHAVASAAQQVLVRGHYKGQGVAVLQEPDSSTPMAAVIGFKAVGGSLAIKAWDGDPGTYVPVADAPLLSTTAWHQIIIALNFSTKKYSVMVNGITVANDVDFHSASISGMSEFLAAAQTEANVDALGFFTSDGDFDDDGLPDFQEISLGTDPFNPDTDEDEISDGDEINVHFTDPKDADSDDDGLTDGQEIIVHNTAPSNPDTDGDGLLDGAEVNTHGTNPLASDTDGDGLSDGDEVNTFLTNPLSSDTDNDTFSDGFELQVGSNPLLLSSTPVTRVRDFINGVITLSELQRLALDGNGDELIDAADIPFLYGANE